MSIPKIFLALSDVWRSDMSWLGRESFLLDLDWVVAWSNSLGLPHSLLSPDHTAQLHSNVMKKQEPLAEVMPRNAWGSVRRSLSPYERRMSTVLKPLPTACV